MRKPKPPKLLEIAAALLLIAAIIYGCKKDRNLVADNLTPDQTVIHMQEWLGKQKADSLTSYAARNLLNNADWKTAHTLIGDSSKIYEIVALPSTATFDDPAKTQQRYLVLLKQGDSTTGYIYELFGNKTDLATQVDLAITKFNNMTVEGAYCCYYRLQLA